MLIENFIKSFCWLYWIFQTIFAVTLHEIITQREKDAVIWKFWWFEQYLWILFVLATVAEKKTQSDKRNLRKQGFILSCSSRVLSIIARGPRSQEFEATVSTAFTTRKQRTMNVCAQQTFFTFYRLGPTSWNGSSYFHNRYFHLNLPNIHSTSWGAHRLT